MAIKTTRPSSFLTYPPLPFRVALIAIHAVVYITADVRVLEIGCVVIPMATRALEQRIGR